MAKSKTAAKSKPAAKSVPKSKPVANPAAVLADADNNGAGAKVLNLIEEAKPAPAVNAAESAPAEPAAKKSKAKAAVTTVTPVVEQNGIKQPGEGTFCRKIWDVLSALHAEGKDATFATAREALKGEQMADATVRTQYARWKTHHGIKREEKKPARKPAAAKQAAPAVVSKEDQQQAS